MRALFGALKESCCEDVRAENFRACFGAVFLAVQVSVKTSFITLLGVSQFIMFYYWTFMYKLFYASDLWHLLQVHLSYWDHKTITSGVHTLGENHFITSAKEVMFSVSFVCLFVSRRTEKLPAQFSRSFWWKGGARAKEEPVKQTDKQAVSGTSGHEVCIRAEQRAKGKDADRFGNRCSQLQRERTKEIAYRWDVRLETISLQ